MKDKEIVEEFNKFIKKWTGNSYPHLIDSDENDGEIFRRLIEKSIKESIKRGRKQLTEEQEKRCKVCNQPTQCIVSCCCNCNFPKEVE